MSKINTPETIWINKSKSGKGLKIGLKTEDGKWVNYISSVAAMNDFLKGDKNGVAFNDAETLNLNKETQ